MDLEAKSTKWAKWWPKRLFDLVAYVFQLFSVHTLIHFLRGEFANSNGYGEGNTSKKALPMIDFSALDELADSYSI